MTVLQKDKGFPQAMSPLASTAGSWGNTIMRPKGEKPLGRLDQGSSTSKCYHGSIIPPTDRYLSRKEPTIHNAIVEPYNIKDDVQELINDITVSSHVEKWRRSVTYMSSITKMKAEPSYRHIVGIGEPAVPTLLREIARQPDFLVLALKEITGVDPVLAEHRGHVQQMAEDWVKWGRDRYGK